MTIKEVGATTQTDYKAAYDRQCARVKELEKALSEQIEHTSRALRELAEIRSLHRQMVEGMNGLGGKLIDDAVG